MEGHVWTALTASVLAAAVTSSGLSIIRRFEAWGRRNLTYFACFAAGVLISASFLHIIIERPDLGALLALSAGALVYVGATHLLPQAEKEPRQYSLVALGTGILVAIIIVLSEQ